MTASAYVEAKPVSNERKEKLIRKQKKRLAKQVKSYRCYYCWNNSRKKKEN